MSSVNSVDQLGSSCWRKWIIFCSIGFALLPYNQVQAQYTKLLDFGNVSLQGASPDGDLYFDGTYLYGMTSGGGVSDNGTIFKMKANGTGYIKLLDFDGENGSAPYGSLISDGTFLYGTTNGGNSTGNGTVFKIKPDGTGFVKLVDFNGEANGGSPYASLLLVGSALYGTTSWGGADGLGTIFKVQTDGSGFTMLYQFTQSNGGNTDYPIKAYQGSYPRGSLTFDGTFLYGTTSSGGNNDLGTLFKIKPDGSGFSLLVSLNNIYGASPNGSLISDGTFLYGTASSGGSSGLGTLFKILPNGTGFVKLLDFVGSNGSSPQGSLFYDGTYLVGTAISGGANNTGLAFKVKPDGTGYANLINFAGAANGSYPNGSFISDGTSLYAFTNSGGSDDLGTIFKINGDGSGYVKLYEFTNTTIGAFPSGSLYFDGIYLYGMTSSGGANEKGVLFKVLPDGTGYKEIVEFSRGLDGSSPFGSVISDGTYLYGMTNTGNELYNMGTVFKVKPDGTGFVTLVNFDGYDGSGADGSYPYGDLYYDGSYLYGMTSAGGSYSQGTVFKLKTDGSGLTTLVTFDGINKGSSPYGSLISDGTYLYGMTSDGGASDGGGNIFKVKKDGTGFSTLLDFGGAISDGYSPRGSLIYDGTFLYGMTSGGGSESEGTVFKIKTDGTEYLKLLDFTFDSNGISDGASPDGSLVYDGTYLYGMTEEGSDNSNTGILFKIKPDGTDYSKLLDFGGDNGAKPRGSLLQIGSSFYGLTNSGGASNRGAMFKYTIPSTNSITVGSQPSAVSACIGQTATFAVSASGTTNITYQWQYSADGIVPFADISNSTNYSNVNTATLSIITAGDYGAGAYRCKISGDLVTTVFTNDEKLILNNLPTSPNAANTVLCSSGSATITATGGTNGQYRWYTIATGGTAITGEANATYITPSLTSTTTYYVAINNGMCESARTSLVVTLSPAITPPATTAIALCSPGSTTLTATGGTNGQYRWYTVATGGAAITGEVNATYITPSLSGTTTYYVAINNGTCESARTSLTVTLSPAIPPPATTATTLCSPGSTTLTATGGTNGQYRWYTVSTGGTAITGEVNSTYMTPSLTSTTTYYVSLSNGTCESTRTGLTVTVSPVQPKPTVTASVNTVNNTATVCTGATVTLSVGNATGYTWSTGEATQQIVVSTGGQYTVATKNALGCASPASDAITVVVNTCSNEAPIIASASVVSEVGGSTSLSIVSLIGNLGSVDLATLSVTKPPSSGARATLDGNGILTIDYTGLSFMGQERLTVGACSFGGACSTQELVIDVGTVIAYNGISANGDAKNAILLLKYIEVLEGTKKNHVTVYNRWGDAVFEVDDYDNSGRVFAGQSTNGSDLPAGTYFYKIEYASGRKAQTGYLSLKR